MHRLFYLVILYSLFVNAVVRQYYIAADEVIWDYGPLDKDGVTGRLFNDSMDMHGESPAMWVMRSNDR